MVARRPRGSNFLKRLAAEIDDRGTIDVVRRGVKDQGVEIRLAYFKPAHDLTPELVARYDANRLTLVRQLAFAADETKTIDLAILLNGIPVATAELKNPLTGQDVENAITQYRRDRDPTNVTLARRAVVHFAVDPYLVKMTTKLAGKATQFLPFNRGSEDGGAGNPLMSAATALPTCGRRSGSATRGLTCSGGSCKRSRRRTARPPRSGPAGSRSSRVSISGTRCAGSRPTRASTAPDTATSSSTPRAPANRIRSRGSRTGSRPSTTPPTRRCSTRS